MNKNNFIYNDNSLYEIINTSIDKNIFFLTNMTSEFIPAHWHDEIEIVLLHKGRADYTINGNRHILSPGQFFLVNSHVIHTVSFFDAEVTLIQIPISFLQIYVPNIRNYIFTCNYTTTNPVERTKLDKLKEILIQLYITDDIRS